MRASVSLRLTAVSPRLRRILLELMRAAPRIERKLTTGGKPARGGPALERDCCEIRPSAGRPAHLLSPRGAAGMTNPRSGYPLAHPNGQSAEPLRQHGDFACRRNRNRHTSVAPCISSMGPIDARKDGAEHAYRQMNRRTKPTRIEAGTFADAPDLDQANR